MIPIHILLELEEMLDLPWLMALQVTGGLFVARQSSLQQWCSTDSVALTPVVLAGSCCSTHGKSAALVYFILARFPSVLAAVFSCTAAPSSLRETAAADPHIPSARRSAPHIPTTPCPLS
jgi:hypothetical protein